MGLFNFGKCQGAVYVVNRERVIAKAFFNAEDAEVFAKDAEENDP